MKGFASALAAAAILPATVQALVPIYYQCGGQGYTGETECDAGLVCVYSNPWYSQCLQPAPGQTTVPPSGGVTTTTSTTDNPIATTTKSTTSSTKTTTSTTQTTSTTTGTTVIPTPPGGIVGYATLNGGTTGGAGGGTTTVSDLAGLRAAVKGTAAKIVRINTMITGDGDEVDIGSNTSILGGCGGGLTGGGFRIKGGKNVIIRNLKLHHSKAPVDLISVYTSSNVWIDHNELWSEKGSDKDEYDGGIDITHAGDYVTISWNYIHDHWKTSLVGHSDGNESEDKGKFHVSYHHNYYKNIGSRVPSLRFGTGHVWNNVADTVSESCVNSRLGAQMLVENNIFINAAKPLLTKTYGGFAVERGNDWGGQIPELSPGTLNSAPYAYTLEATSTTKASVLAGAGACKVTV